MSSDVLVGQAGLVSRMCLKVPAPAVTSTVGPGERRTIIENGRVVTKYRRSHMPDDTLSGHLKFALRYEPVDMGVLNAAFRGADTRELETWIRSEPNGVYARRAWFLYEWLTGKTLDVPDAGVVAYVGALDPEMNLTTEGVSSRRHKVIDNLLGVPGLCPTVRLTDKLRPEATSRLSARAAEIVEDCDPDILQRAVNYLYHKETKSTFEIERENVSGQRAERFVSALQSSSQFDPTSSADLLSLQNVIVDQRYAATGLRDFQNFVGESAGGWREIVHFICPKPEDIASLMDGWSAMTGRLMREKVDPIAAATLSAFSFVFNHPYADGNGRIHRFLIHKILASHGFTPPDVLFPVSAAIVRDRPGYDRALETFSGSIKPFIDYSWTDKREIVVTNDTSDLYRYFDATPLAEFLHDKVAETINKDLKDELDFVAVYDRAMTAVRDVVDMPDRRASLLVRILMQNDGKMSRKKRAEFDELTDREIDAIEAGIQEARTSDEPAAAWRP